MVKVVIMEGAGMVELMDDGEQFHSYGGGHRDDQSLSNMAVECSMHNKHTRFNMVEAMGPVTNLNLLLRGANRAWRAKLPPMEDI